MPNIKKISCGPNHTVAVDENNKVDADTHQFETFTHLQAFSWGFGGYGRLGHSETADELVRTDSGLLSFSTKFRIGFVINNLKGTTSYQVPRWKEPWCEGSYLWLCVQPWHLGNPGDGEHVGHLHD